MTKKAPRQTRTPHDGSRAGANAETSEHLEQVRAILFGEQFAAFEDRLRGLEHRILDAQAALRDQTSQRLDAVAAAMEKQLHAVRGAVDDGEAEHRRAVAELSAELGRSATETEKRLAEVRRDAERLVGEVRAHTSQRADALAARLNDQSSTLSALVEQKLEELRALTTDRESLAALFEEMATRLKRSPSA